MTPEERNSRTAELFHDACAYPSLDRQLSFLGEACAGNNELFERVKRLLELDAETSGSRPLTVAEPGSAPFEISAETLAAIAQRYDGLKYIGHGGMGSVYRAQDREVKKSVALKLLQPSLAGDAQMIERFRNEISLSWEVTHKNVCRTHSLEIFNGTICISMEYVEGETLRGILRRVKGVSVPQGLLWSQEICDALGAAHERGIVHRDLKPENIMIDGSGHVKVMDFGIARSSQESEGGSSTRIGTPGYMSPEQESGGIVRPASDIYSLGLVLHELFTGERRGVGRTGIISQSADFLPAPITHAIQKCLAENPAQRFQNASELKAALTGRPDARGQSQLTRGRRRRSLIFTSIVVSVLAVIAAGGVYVAQRNRPSPAGMHQDDDITDLVFSPNGRLLASASEDKTVVLWDVALHQRIRTLPGHIGAVTCVAFSSNGHWLASGGADRSLKVWEVDSGRLSRSLSDPKTIAAVALSPDGRWLASTSDETLKIWNLETGRLTRTLRQSDDISTLAFSPDGHLLASAGADNTARVWEVETGHAVGGSLRHDDAVDALAFSADGKMLASGSLDKTIKLWQVDTWRAVQTLWQGARVSYLIFNTSGQLISIGDDGRVKVWEPPTWRESLLADERRNGTWALSPDGRILAIGHTDGTIQLRSLLSQ